MTYTSGESKSQNSRYFTPNLEDIRVGYYCEYSTNVHAFKDDNDPRIKRGILDLNAVLDLLSQHSYGSSLEGMVRVPYISDDDLMQEGWMWQIQPWTTVSWKKKDYVLTIWDWEDTKWVHVFKPSTDVVYWGECKDINTLRTIQKLLNI